MTRHTVGIDPDGTSGAACAHGAGGVLVRLFFADALDCLRGAWPDQLSDPLTYEWARVAVERPQQDGRSGAIPPAILMTMTRNAYAVAMAFRAPVVELYPSEWKGSCPKPQHHLRIWEDTLTPAERILFPAGTESAINKACEKGARDAWRKPGAKYYPDKFKPITDLLDACGLMLFECGRIDKDGMPDRAHGPLAGVRP